MHAPRSNVDFDTNRLKNISAPKTTQAHLSERPLRKYSSLEVETPQLSLKLCSIFQRFVGLMGLGPVGTGIIIYFYSIYSI